VEKIKKRMKIMYEQYRQKDFFWGALIGGTVATLTALLFTTKKGKQLQHQIGEVYEGIESAAKDMLSSAEGKVEEGIENVEEAGKKIADKFKSGNFSQKDSK
jgi:gas vesicle protein